MAQLLVLDSGDGMLWEKGICCGSSGGRKVRVGVAETLLRKIV